MKAIIPFLTLYLIILLNFSNIFAAAQPPEISKAEILYESVLRNHTTAEELRALIASGIDINVEEEIREETRGFTALHMAAYYGLYQGIAPLLDSGADINKPVGPSNKLLAGMTALQLSIIRKLLPVIQALLKHKAKMYGPVIDNPHIISSTLTCLVLNMYSDLHQYIRSFLKAPDLDCTKKLNALDQLEIINFARELINAGFELDQDAKLTMLQYFDIDLNF
jgi:hypothetical protein